MLLAAVAVGLGALAKVAVIPLALAIAATTQRMSLAARAAVLLPIGLAAPLFLPSLRFQLDHAFVAPQGAPWTAVGALGSLVAAVVAQALLWSPWVLWRGARALPRMPLPDRAAVGLLTALCAASAIVRGLPPEPNWWAAAAIVVVIAAATGAPDLAPRRRIAMLATAILPGLIAGAHTLHPFLPLPQRADPTARLHGWSSGHEPLEAPGIGAYGPAAERCVYRQQCDDIKSYFDRLDDHLTGIAPSLGAAPGSAERLPRSGAVEIH